MCGMFLAPDCSLAAFVQLQESQEVFCRVSFASVKLLRALKRMVRPHLPAPSGFVYSIDLEILIEKWSRIGKAC